MAEHGDDVLNFLQEVSGELPEHDNDISWNAIAVHYLSKAVELFCAINSELEDWEDEEPINA